MADDNLDSYLFPKDSPYNSREDFVTAYDFDVTHQIPAGGINYTNLTAASRAATAVISLSGEKGTFKDIQAAINYVNSLGGGKILVLPGTYTITQNITLYGDITLEGLSTANCIFDFNSTTSNLSTSINASNIKIRSLTFKNCHNVTTGAIFLNRVIRGEISGCTFETNTSGSGTGYDIYADLPRFVSVNFCLSTSSGGFYYADNSSSINQVVFNNIDSPNGRVFTGGSTGTGGGRTNYLNNNITSPRKAIFSGEFSQSIIDGNTCDSTSLLTETFITITSTASLKFVNNYLIVVSAAQQQVITISGSNNIHFTGNRFQGSKDSSPALEITSSESIYFSANAIVAEAFGTSIDGIKLTDTDECVISGNKVTGVSNGTSYGVNISNAACDNTVVVGNALFGISGNTLDNGTGSVIASNS